MLGIVPIKLKLAFGGGPGVSINDNFDGFCLPLLLLMLLPLLLLLLLLFVIDANGVRGTCSEIKEGAATEVVVDPAMKGAFNRGFSNVILGDLGDFGLLGGSKDCGNRNDG
mmetsp:Transcript_2067/g.2964  ORF Transcript_2067/g.2964 Transcript_2067/m.2964 type:complete len:111 (+) Transcript_2067:455-787(+)